MQINEIRNRGQIARALIRLPYGRRQATLRVFRDREEHHPVAIHHCRQDQNPDEVQFYPQLEICQNAIYKIAFQKASQNPWNAGEKLYINIRTDGRCFRQEIVLPDPSISPTATLPNGPFRSPTVRKRARQDQSTVSAKSRKVKTLLERYQQIEDKQKQVDDLSQKLTLAKKELEQIKDQTRLKESEISQQFCSNIFGQKFDFTISLENTPHGFIRANK